MAHADEEITLPRLSAPVLARPEAHSPSGSFYDGEDEATMKFELGASDAHRWLVQLELESEQIVPLYRLGLTHGAVVWRDGMQDWRPLMIMRELRQVLAAHRSRGSRSTRLRLSSLTQLDSRRPKLEPLAEAESVTSGSPPKKPKSVPPPAPSSRASFEVTSRVEAALEPRRVIAPKEPAPEPESAADPGLALLMELNHPRPRPRRIEVRHAEPTEPPPVVPSTAPPFVSPAEPVVSPAEPVVSPPTPLEFVAPAPPANAYSGAFVPPRTAGAGALAVVAPALLAVALTALFFWFGPVKTARQAAEQAERAIWLMSPRREAPRDTRAPSDSTQAPTDAAAKIPVMSVTDISTPAAEAAPRARARAESKPAEAESKPARRVSSAAPRRESAPAPRPPSGEPDRGAIARALGAAAWRTAGCDEGGRGSARAVVTFGSSGAVRSVQFESALPQGVNRSCVYSALSRARIPPFSGEAVTVRKTLRF